ncbi:uncharacterized protein ighd isoform X3 [Brienomyrus brachyistius]|uniref:uncharacterized protein ighd isoform X3 n=1 Tax=Brienomyrus brachyistius TaxID=42636 RepID=UPI0020B3AC17|nr:uncharacterized protein ighd isoform X3 [Brienomyrus brachyistius]
MITVTSGSQTKPAVFPLQSCASDSSKDLVDIGCLATGYVPSRSVTFTWRDKGKGSDISDFVQYPEVQSNGAFSVFTQIKVKAEDWLKSNAYTCNVNQGQTTESADVIRMEEKPLYPNMTLYVSPWTEDAETVNLLCVLNGIRPNKINVKWEVITGTTSENVPSDHEFMVPKNGNEKGTTLISLVSLEMEKWSSGISYQCKANDKSLNNSRKISFCSAYPSSSMYLEKLTLERQNQTHIAADCTAVGPYGTTLSLLVDDALKSTAKVPAGSEPKKITCNLSYPSEKWKKSVKITCKVKHQCYSSLEKTINIPHSTEPTVKLFLLPKEPDSRVRTLLCLGTGLNPQIKWLKGSSVAKVPRVTTMQNEGQLTVSSEMNVQKEEWNKWEIFTCQVEDQLSGAAVHQNISKCTVTPPSSQTATVSIVGPSLKEKLGSGALQVLCHVLAYEDEAFSITWKMNDKVYTRETRKRDNSNGTQTLSSTLSVERQDWEKKPRISCQVRHRCSSSTQEKQLEQSKDPKKPTLQIIRPSKGQVDKQHIATLLCLILDFFPADIDVYWELNGIQLPQSQYSNSPVLGVAGRGDDGGYSMHSMLQIPQSGRNDGQYSCVVKHESSKEPLRHTTSIKNGEHTVKLFLLPKEPDSRVRTLLCLGTGLNPQIKWLKGSSVAKVPRVTTMQNEGQLTVSSEMNVQKEEWNKWEIFTCQVEDQLSGAAVHQNISKCTVTPPSSQTATVSIVGPSLKEKLGSGALQVLCHVLAYEDEAFSITWKMNDKVYTRETRKRDNSNGTQTLSSTLSVERQDWEKKPRISCQVRHPCSSSTQEKQLEQSKDPKKPTLQIIRPSKGQVDKQHIATLFCLILDFFPADIDVYWELNGLQLSQSHYYNSPVLGVAGRGDDGGYSMHSMLQIPQSDRNDGQYSCVVKHESSKEPLRHTTSIKNVLSTLEVINEEDENINIANDTAQEDNLIEIWNTALTFIILFLISVIYSICVTFVKVGARGSPVEFRGKDLRQPPLYQLILYIITKV